MITRPDLILASASPRRRELLERLGLRLKVVAVDLDEAVGDGEPAHGYVQRLAAGKRDAAVVRVAADENDLPVLGADTTVVVDREILGKPRDAGEAAAMLRRLAGRRHQVVTGFAILCGTMKTERVVSSDVTFRLITPAEIDAYVACGEWRDKAGGYALQGIAAMFATELRGSPTNVIGLPLAEVIADLRAVGALAAYPPAAFGVRE